MKESVGVVSLGCAKNRVDTEVMLGLLAKEGYSIISNPNYAEIIIVNTCGFISTAKEESIETILDMANYKKSGVCKILLVTGCLTQRYKEELHEEFPEVDGFLGVNDYNRITDVIDQIKSGKRSMYYSNLPTEYDNNVRILTTPGYYAYVKIAEGCDNCCSYCAIPTIRGPYRSRPIEDIIDEIIGLTQRGVREIILIAQDTTRYGEDIYGLNMLPELLKQICTIEHLHWVRMLYSYPERITAELLRVIQNQPKICKYLDIPIQHIDDTILTAMNRKSSSDTIKELLQNIRSLDGEFYIRTSLIVGFPGETESAFTKLLQFIQEYPFDHLGVFMYSKEEGTRAALMENQVSEKVKEQRYHSIMNIQKQISYQRNHNRLGKIYDVLVEGIHPDTHLYYGRSYGEVPEMDGKIYFSSNKAFDNGSFVRVIIIKAFEYDLMGEVIDEPSK